MPIFYPDNVERSKRVEQLVNDITNAQAVCIDASRKMENNAPQVKKLINEYMKKAGMTTYDELVQRTKDLLPDEDKDRYLKAAEEARKSGQMYEDAFMITSAISVGAVAVLGVNHIVQVVRSGESIIVGLLMANGIWELLKGNFKLGGQLLKSASRVSKGLVAEAEAMGKLGRVLKAVTRVFRVIAVLSVVLDVLILALSAIEGAKQKEELMKYIKILFCRRILVKIASLQADAAKDGQVRAEALLDEINDPDSDPKTVKRLADKMIKNIKDNQAAITFENVKKDLATLDVGRWTNEDPTINSVEEAEKMLNDLDPTPAKTDDADKKDED